MINFKCSINKGKRTIKWSAVILNVSNYGTHRELMIIGRFDKSFRILVGKTLTGNFACFPDLKLGCHLGKLNDVFENMHFLKNILGLEDSITVAHGIRKVEEFYENSDNETNS